MADTPENVNPVFRAQSVAGIPPLRYPENVGQHPFDKFIIFEARSSRTVAQQTIPPESQTTDKVLKSVALYLSESALKDSIEVAYDNAPLGAFMGAAIEYFAQTGGDIYQGKLAQPGEGGFKGLATAGLERIVSAVSSAANTFYSAAKDVPDAIADLLKAEIMPGIDTLTETPGASTALTGFKANPRTSVIYDAAQYRTHQYDFLLIPRSQKEAEAIDGIINFFQFYMLPAYRRNAVNQGLNLGAFLIGVPYEFEIHIFFSPDGVRGDEMTHINRPARSVLKSVSIDHAAGGKTAFIKSKNASGDLNYYPVATHLTLIFQETRLLARDSEEIKRPGFLVAGNSDDDPRG